MQQHSVKYLRRRQFLLVLPLLTVPFATGVLRALDNDKEQKKTAVVKGEHGLNPELPGAHVKEDEALDKMFFYAQTQMDSVKKREQQRTRAFYGQRLGGAPDDRSEADTALTAVQGDMHEEKVYRGLRELNAVLHRPSARPVMLSVPGQDMILPVPARHVGGLDRLEGMMQQLKDSRSDDGDMQAMNDVLNKLLRVQHPEWSRDSSVGSGVAKVRQAWSLMPAPKDAVISSFSEQNYHSGVVQPSEGFYGLSDEPVADTGGNAFPALVPEKQVLMNGSTVKLALIGEGEVSGVSLPPGTALYGTAALNGERLQIAVRSIRTGARLLPVDLRVYDQDGLEGIFIPGAMGRDIMKQSADQGLNGLGLGAYDPSLAGQAASAGLQLAKNLASRKVKLIRVTVEGGYRVWLKDGKGN